MPPSLTHQFLPAVCTCAECLTARTRRIDAKCDAIVATNAKAWALEEEREWFAARALVAPSTATTLRPPRWRRGGLDDLSPGAESSGVSERRSEAPNRAT